MQSLNVGHAFELMSHKAKTDHLLYVLPFYKNLHLLCQEVCFFVSTATNREKRLKLLLQRNV